MTKRDSVSLSLSLKCPFSSPSLHLNSKFRCFEHHIHKLCQAKNLPRWFQAASHHTRPSRCSDLYHFLLAAAISEQSVLLLLRKLRRPRSLGATARGAHKHLFRVTRFSRFMSEEALGLSRQVHVCTESRTLRYKLLIVSRMALIESPGADILGATRKYTDQTNET